MSAFKKGFSEVTERDKDVAKLIGVALAKVFSGVLIGIGIWIGFAISGARIVCGN